jgi:hypothetical protein
MGLQVAPGYIGQSGYSHPVELFRNILEAQTAAGKGYLTATTDFALTPSGAGLSLSVAAGAAAINGLESNTQGSYFAWSNAADSIAWPAASGSPRIDSLILRVIDKQYGADADANGAQWEVCQGTPAGSPVAIADADFNGAGTFHRPGAWWRVCNVLISPGNTVMTATTITDLRTWADPTLRATVAALDAYKTATESAWTPYTPVLSADSGSPNAGVGATMSGRYKQIGKTVHVKATMVIGATGWAAGTGGLYLSLPVTGQALAVSSGGWYGRDVSPAQNYNGMVRADTTKASFFTGNAQVTGSVPHTWAGGDRMEFSLTYEAA